MICPTPKEYARCIGLVIKESRLSHPDVAIRTQIDFAEKAGVNRAYLAGVETGSRMPGLNTLVTICQTLDITMSELFKRAEDQLNTNH